MSPLVPPVQGEVRAWLHALQTLPAASPAGLLQPETRTLVTDGCPVVEKFTGKIVMKCELCGMCIRTVHTPLTFVYISLYSGGAEPNI